MSLPPSPTWEGRPPPAWGPIAPLGWLRVALRGGAVVVVLAAGVVALGLVRGGERLAGAGRRASPWVTVGVCRALLAILGLRWRRHGRAMPARQPGLFVANHASWLDILALNAVAPMIFVAKTEVAGWPGIGALARLTGTVFIRRDRGEAAAQEAALSARLAAGDRLMLFPEGSSSDGLRLLPLKTSLFATALGPRLPEGFAVQPVTVVWRGPPGAPLFYAWWGKMDLAPHLLRVLAQHPQGRVDVVLHPPLVSAEAGGRKALARACAEAMVRPLRQLPG